MADRARGGPAGARLAVEASSAGLAYGSLLCWASTCLVGSFRPQDMADPYWHGIPRLRTDVLGFAAFIVAAVCIVASEYLRLRRRQDVGINRAAASSCKAKERVMGGTATSFWLAVSETVIVMATGLFGYLSLNAVTHPATLQLHVTHLLSGPAEGTLRVMALVLCVCSVTVLRYLWPRTAGRDVVSSAATPQV
jgi:hypothetical protein